MRPFKCIYSDKCKAIHVLLISPHVLPYPYNGLLPNDTQFIFDDSPLGTWTATSTRYRKRNSVKE